ncbi:flagellar filament capping protein FliD [Propionispora hippei]|uniref:Flagellar hook-associated protein 2 n=1 Tax=Propionispora hippei DSM 15287 TaxID=1123003 RepID=A0A1M6C1E3_9FIRM|nr:flagellar filament capping protein FliD [Propionispora hippei]SHI54836.1 flagellar hook-associated protein 2 [Propionispora hippei DSM 15287]
MSSSSSSINMSTVNGTTRVTGLSSGIDVDSIVTQLVTAEKEKSLYKMQKKEQLAEWKQEDYRTITSDIQDFADKYFNVTSSSSLLSTKNFNQYTVTSSSSAVTASYTSEASAGTHTVTVSQLATKETMQSTASLSKDVQGDSAVNFSSLSGKSISLAVDGTSYGVDLSNVTDLNSLQDAVDSAVGSGKITVSENSSNILSFTAADSGVQKIAISAPGSGTSGLSSLGFGSSAILSNRLTTTSTLGDIANQLNSELTFNSDGEIELTINGTSFSFDKDTTLKEMMSEINSSDCGATIAYNDTSDKLVLTASSTGAGNKLSVTEGDGSNFISTFLGSTTAGLDAKVTVDGQLMTRSSNTITEAGVTYTFNSTTSSGDSATVSLTQNVDGIYDLINNFVTDYNSLIDTINGKLQEDYDSDYPPLTDDDKTNMSETQISTYEAKAKVGMLQGDSTLSSFLSELRSTFLDSTSGLSSNIFDIGLDTSDDYNDKGKLTINEDTLKEAIQDNPETVMNIFTKQSTSYSGTTSERTLSSAALATRYKEEGVAYRFYDVIAKYTSTIRDSGGNKGLLLQMAGVSGDASNSDNQLTDQISDYEDKISKEKDRLSTYSDKLYTKYSNLETYINQMNEQLSSLSSMSS